MSDLGAVSNLANAGRETPLPAALQRWRPLCLTVFALVTGYLILCSIRYLQRQWPDFEYFYKGGAWLYQHGGLDAGYDVLDDADAPHGGRLQGRGTIEWYWPFVSRFMTLFGWMPYSVAGGLWLVFNLLALYATLRLTTQYLDGWAARDWPTAQILPFLFIIVFWVWEFLLNQINNFTLLLLLASFVLWLKGRRGIAGFWLGLAVLLKITPVLMVFWFLLKRQFKTVAVAVLTVALAGPVSDVIVFGVDHTRDLYKAWLHISIEKSSQRNLVLLQREMDWRNQSLAAVFSRWLHPTNYNTHFDNDPRPIPATPERTVNVAHLPLPTIAKIVTVVMGLSVLGLIWIARKPARALTPWQLRFEFALFLLAMLWLMPVMRRYHLVWCFPALSLLLTALYCVGWRHIWTRITSVCVALIVLTQISLWSEWFEIKNVPEARGVLLAVIPLLAGPVVAMLFWLARNPAAIPKLEAAAPQAVPARHPKPPRQNTPSASLPAHV